MLRDTIIRNYVAFFNARKAHKKLTPLPVKFWLKQREKLHRFSTKTDVLRPSARVIRSKGQDLSIPELAKLFSDILLGTWTLDQSSITLVWEHLQQGKPDIIIECGSGVSTLLFSYFFKNHHPGGKLISFEQNTGEKIRVENWLKSNKLDQYACILHSPLDTNGRYTFDLQKLEQLLGNQKADWLVIDGPAGSKGCRDNTLPAMIPYMKQNARWWMDDSFRDGELAYLEEWENNKRIQIDGIYPIGNGLGVGRVS